MKGECKVSFTVPNFTEGDAGFSHVSCKWSDLLIDLRKIQCVCLCTEFITYKGWRTSCSSIPMQVCMLDVKPHSSVSGASSSVQRFFISVNERGTYFTSGS